MLYARLEMRKVVLGVIGVAALAGCEQTGSHDVCAEPGTICTVAGTGEGGALSLPSDVVVDPDTGTVYILDFNNLVVRALDPGGDLQVVAGSGELGDTFEGPALEADLNHLGDLLLDGDGGMYIAAWHNSRVLHLDLAAGTLRHVAATGARAYDGDGGAAVDADFDLPSSLAWTPNGDLLVTDQSNQVIRRIDLAAGTVDHFAGRCLVDPDGPCDTPVACPDSAKLACDAAQCSYPCQPGFAGDRATVAELRLALPFGAQALPGGKLAAATDGTLYIADCLNARVRAVAPNGDVDTVAGGGAFTGEGVDATEAVLGQPIDVALAPDGTLYIADIDDHCIRRVDPDGSIHTAAGDCGISGYAGDRGPADNALLDRPLGIHLDPTGNRLYIADTVNHRIRAVAL